MTFRALTPLLFAGALLCAGAARAECDAPVDCAPGKQVQKCSICEGDRCGCWFKRTGEEDLACGRNCACEGAAAEVDAWCTSSAEPKTPSCGAAPVSLALLALLFRARRRAPLIAVAVLTLTGCSKQFIRVDAVYPPLPPPSAPAPEARATDAFKAKATPVKSLVFRLPDDCYKPSAAKLAVPELESRCAEWLGEVERAFKASGYEVLPWTSLRTLEQQEGMQPIPAARKLGAQALMNIARLGTSDVRGKSAAPPNISLAASNPDGENKGAASLPPDHERAARAVVEGKLASVAAESTTAAFAELEAAAVLPDSGEWFFNYKLQWTRWVAPLQSTSFLLRGRGEHWRPIRPKSASAASDAGVAQPKPEDRAEIIKAIASSLAQRFQAEAG